MRIRLLEPKGHKSGLRPVHPVTLICLLMCMYNVITCNCSRWSKDWGAISTNRHLGSRASEYARSLPLALRPLSAGGTS